MSAKKILLAYDFDHTIVDDNSDLHIKTLSPDGEIPQEIEDQYNVDGWTNYMQAIFTYLHSKGITANDMKTCMQEIPLTHGMKELLELASNDRYENIIISDSNSVFIEFILDKFRVSDMFHTVYTNPATFDKEGRLNVRFYHTQDWCSLSTVNLCKGHILEEHIKLRQEQGQEFSHVVYIGDGSNDLCPALRLRDIDVICARKHFRLWKKINKLLESKKEKDAENKARLKARIFEWESGMEIVELLQEIEKKNLN